MSGGGESIKQEQLAMERGANRVNDATGQIEAQKMAEVGQREYAGQVRKEEQAYQSGEAEKQRQFASLESKYGRDFAASQAELERNQKQSMFNVQQKFASKQFDWQKKVNERDYALDEEVTRFNMKMAEKAAKPKGMSAWSMGSMGDWINDKNATGWIYNPAGTAITGWSKETAGA
jgi:hypothetical protein